MIGPPAAKNSSFLLKKKGKNDACKNILWNFCKRSVKFWKYFLKKYFCFRTNFFFFFLKIIHFKLLLLQEQIQVCLYTLKKKLALNRASSNSSGGGGGVVWVKARPCPPWMKVFLFLHAPLGIDTKKKVVGWIFWFLLLRASLLCLPTIQKTSFYCCIQTLGCRMPSTLCSRFVSNTWALVSFLSQCAANQIRDNGP